MDTIKKICTEMLNQRGYNVNIAKSEEYKGNRTVYENEKKTPYMCF